MHRSVRLRHDGDLLEERRDGVAVAEYAVRAHAVRRRLVLGKLLLEAMALSHQPLAIACDDAVELDRLTDEIGDHRQEAYIRVEPEHGLTVPDPVDRQRTHHLTVGANGNADERYRRSVVALE